MYNNVFMYRAAGQALLISWVHLLQCCLDEKRTAMNLLDSLSLDGKMDTTSGKEWTEFLQICWCEPRRTEQPPIWRDAQISWWLHLQHPRTIANQELWEMPSWINRNPPSPPKPCIRACTGSTHGADKSGIPVVWLPGGHWWKPGTISHHTACSRAMRTWQNRYFSIL